MSVEEHMSECRGKDLKLFKFLDKEHQRMAIIPLLDNSSKLIHECRACRYRMRVHQKNVVVKNYCERNMKGNEYMELQNIAIIPKECKYLVREG